MLLFALANLADAASRFCKDDPSIEINGTITGGIDEASALAFNDDHTLLFTINDSPKDRPLLFVLQKKTEWERVQTITVTGIKNTGYNGGFGDWEAIAYTNCPSDRSKKCVLIGDIGDNCARGGRGVLRTDETPARIIEVEEPSVAEVSAGVLDKPGKEYTFTYPKGPFDAEAMVVKDGVVFIVTKNSKRYPYSHMFRVGFSTGTATLTEAAVFDIKASQVTDATSTPSHLVLRTYIGLNFYRWDRICDEDEDWHEIEYLQKEKDRGQHEAVAFHIEENTFFFLGERSWNLYTMFCPDAVTDAKSPPPTCADRFNGKADGIQQQCRSNTGSNNTNQSPEEEKKDSSILSSFIPLLVGLGVLGALAAGFFYVRNYMEEQKQQQQPNNPVPGTHIGRAGKRRREKKKRKRSL